MRIIVLLSILFIFACQSEVDKKKYPKETHHQTDHDEHAHNHGTGHGESEHNHKSSTEHKVLKESTEEYSQDFLRGLMSQKENKNILIDAGKLILNNTDTIPFPEDPPMHKAMNYAAQNSTHQVSASIKRINFTTIYYKITITESSGSICEHEGNADLSPYFFLASESDVNAITGEAYLSTEYSSAIEGCEYLNIRIGKPKVDAPYLLNLVMDCAGDCSPLSVDDGLILVEL